MRSKSRRSISAAVRAPQTVVVERVHVNDGGHDIVGHVSVCKRGGAEKVRNNLMMVGLCHLESATFAIDLPLDTKNMRANFNLEMERWNWAK
jgi:hypothetical protein